MALQGKRELQARLRAIRQTFKPVGKSWADTTAHYAQGHVPVRTGRLKASIRVKSATQRKATVVGAYWGNFVDAGTKEHRERARKRKAMRYGTPGGTRFSKRVLHPRTRAQPFKRAAALEGLRQNPMAETVIKQWNDAA